MAIARSIPACAVSTPLRVVQHDRLQSHTMYGLFSSLSLSLSLFLSLSLSLYLSLSLVLSLSFSLSVYVCFIAQSLSDQKMLKENQFLFLFDHEKTRFKTHILSFFSLQSSSTFLFLPILNIIYVYDMLQSYDFSNILFTLGGIILLVSIFKIFFGL